MCKKSSLAIFSFTLMLILSFLHLACKKKDLDSPSQHLAALPEITTDSGHVMILILGGRFIMGSITGNADEAFTHEVSISPFALGKYEVTQKFLDKLEYPNPSHFKGPDLPVEQIRWVEAAIYCNELSLSEGLELCYDEVTLQCNFDATGYRLPTEAEWECAARADTETTYEFGKFPKNLKKYAYYADNSLKRTHRVGKKKSNRWGLFDMYGNVAEWCNDIYSENYYQQSLDDNPPGPKSGKKRILRGGSWDSSASACRSAARAADIPGIVDACFARDTYGFRLARKLNQQELKMLSK